MRHYINGLKRSNQLRFVGGTVLCGVLLFCGTELLYVNLNFFRTCSEC